MVRKQPEAPLSDAMIAAEMAFNIRWSKSASIVHVAEPVEFLLAQMQCARLCRWRK
ncbi:hypothetical protein RMSM_03927 [Rhodopirellula maiorica SM1]|uniref:Uncharacterized protein n=1 Tax=Rhodopirellula maiorica SM1 TaxID=1265738 RepID=M5RIM6_9BACT|nr:hypothetical protein RMSM_03927 [Rhodopirellula maiorica SM1]